MEHPKTLLEAIKYFSDEQVCIDAVAAMKWSDGQTRCAHCNALDPYYLKTQKRWKCRKCRKQFSVKVGTIFEDSPISLTKWLPAMWLLANCKNGISSWEIHRALGVTQKTAWFMLQRIRLAFERKGKTKLGGENGGPVEVDETFIGPNPAKMHRARRLKLKQGECGQTKAIVMGMLDRDLRQVHAMVVPNVRRDTLQCAILNNVQRKSTVYSDQFVAYDDLSGAQRTVRSRDREPR